MSPTTTDHRTPATDETAAPATSQLVVLRLGREEYALPIDHVQEIVFWTPPRPVSSDRPWVSGVIALRGKILPVFDLALRLGVPRGTDGGARIVIVETGGDPIGVTVDDATEVLTVGAADLEPLPHGTTHDLLRAITKVGDRLIAVLDLTTLATGPAAEHGTPDDATTAPDRQRSGAAVAAGPGATVGTEAAVAAGGRGPAAGPVAPPAVVAAAVTPVAADPGTTSAPAPGATQVPPR